MSPGRSVSCYRLGLTLAALALFPACNPRDVHFEDGVSLKLATERAARVDEVRYRLLFAIPHDPAQRIHAELDLRFRLSDADAPLALDFAQHPESVLEMSIPGSTGQNVKKPVDYRAENGHLVIPSAALAQGENHFRIRFLAGDGPLNRRGDYLYTLFVPDRASEAFPCFDQPDLKARFQVTLDMPSGWQAVANGGQTSRVERQGRSIVTFGESAPISTYIFSFAAGRFQIIEREIQGRRMRLFHRESDPTNLDRNSEEIFRLHAAALGWLEEYTAIPYPFEKFDFVLIPAFQYGGMEHPGAILYRASSLLLDPSATQSMKLRRASLIAHETAHMWFGDLVTMKWFDDVWTKEVFANLMASKIAHPSFPEIDHELRFLLAHYPAAYGVDRTAGANPIRQPLQNLAEASSLYGAIIYQKAPVVMKHLERLIGAEELRDGLREYLQTFSFGNAAWVDLIEILDRKTPLDLRAWSRVWVEEPGRPVIDVEWSSGQDGKPTLSVRQSDPGQKGRRWIQDLQVKLGPPVDRTFSIRLDGESSRVPESAALPRPRFVIANSAGRGYGHFRLDPVSRGDLLEHLPQLKAPIERAVGWLGLWEALLDRKAPPDRLMALGIELLAEEDVEQIVGRILGDIVRLHWRYFTSESRSQHGRVLEEALWQGLELSEKSTLKSSYFSAYVSVATSPQAVDRMRRVWSGRLKIEGLSLGERDLTRLALELAVREAAGWSEILEGQLKRIENPDRRQRLSYLLPALSADSAARDAFFAGLSHLENRRHEPWVLDGMRYLHHPLRSSESVKYLRPGLDLLREVRQTGDIFFPKRWLDAMLAGHNSDQAARIVQQFLDENPDYPPRLRQKILQSADGLFRAASIVSR